MSQEKKIEEILNKNIEFNVNFERADDPTGDLVDKDNLIKDISKLLTEAQEEAILGFIKEQFIGRNYLTATNREYWLKEAEKYLQKEGTNNGTK